jgi:hypothetical protein
MLMQRLCLCACSRAAAVLHGWARHLLVMDAPARLPAMHSALQAVAVEQQACAPGTVIVSVRAVGINFRYPISPSPDCAACMAMPAPRRCMPVCSAQQSRVEDASRHAGSPMSAALKQLQTAAMVTFCLCAACRDVLNVLGMYPGDPGDPGGDCAGGYTLSPQQLRPAAAPWSERSRQALTRPAAALWLQA